MEEIGKIIEQKDQEVKIEITPVGGCAHCSQSNICNPFGQNKKVIELKNTINAQIGDWVKIEITEKNRIASVLIILGIPIIFFLIGIIIGHEISGDKMSAILAGLGLIIAFTIVKFINNYWLRKNKEFAIIKEKIKSV
jgi:sigma-E factor negative regulatory protein RseC